MTSSKTSLFRQSPWQGPMWPRDSCPQKTIRRAVAARQGDVASAQDLFQMCCNRLLLPRDGVGHCHTKRRFVYIGSGHIDRCRPERTATKPLKNTRQTHCIRGIKPYVLSVRECSSFCDGCRNEWRLPSHWYGRWLERCGASPRKKGTTTRFSANTKQPPSASSCRRQFSASSYSTKVRRSNI